MLLRITVAMAPMTVTTAHCRLIAVLETDAHGAGLERLEAVLAATDGAVACAILKPLPGLTLGHCELQTVVRRLQAADVAVLLVADAELARELGADGVHLLPTDDEAEARARYAIARAALGGERTVGASAGLSKHMAMVHGEIGADYVAFEGAGASDLALWWAPLFEVPVVAMGVETASDAERLAASGVDFVGLELGGGPVEAIAQHACALAQAIATGEAAS